MQIRDYIKPLKRMARTSKAKLGGVACFFVKNGAIISSGINYNPTGGPMEIELDASAAAHGAEDSAPELIAHPGVIHAELSAIEAAAKNQVDLTGSALFVTMSPCIKCAQEIKKTGIKELYYLYEWWDKASIDLLEGCGIKVVKLEEER
ncbi:deaminase [Candidatus Saccharibacteria bacterium]|nr:deaminase [Candidatus Saccharibacteria bacterium]